MKTVSITSSTDRADFQFSSSELCTDALSSHSASLLRRLESTQVNISVLSSTPTVFVSIRPTITERESITKRMNRALELGYTPPLRVTTSDW